MLCLLRLSSRESQLTFFALQWSSKAWNRNWGRRESAVSSETAKMWCSPATEHGGDSGDREYRRRLLACTLHTNTQASIHTPLYTQTEASHNLALYIKIFLFDYSCVGVYCQCMLICCSRVVWECRALTLQTIIQQGKIKKEGISDLGQLFWIHWMST